VRGQVLTVKYCQVPQVLRLLVSEALRTYSATKRNRWPVAFFRTSLPARSLAWPSFWQELLRMACHPPE